MGSGDVYKRQTPPPHQHAGVRQPGTAGEHQHEIAIPKKSFLGGGLEADADVCAHHARGPLKCLDRARLRQTKVLLGRFSEPRGRLVRRVEIDVRGSDARERHRLATDLRGAGGNVEEAAPRAIVVRLSLIHI